MKKKRRIWTVLSLLLILVLVIAAGCWIYTEVQKTPDEIVEIEKKKAQAVYNENLNKALDIKHQYDFVVVLNPAHGGRDVGHENAFGTEKEITLAICNKVIENNTNTRIGIFLTRTEDIGMEDALRLSFVEEIKPDLFIDVHLNKNASVGTYGTSVSYDTTYFNRRLTNAEFADIMEKSVVSAIEGFAMGIEDVTDKEEGTLLKSLTIPAVSIACGDMSNEKEGELLTRDSYQTNLAKGILEGIDIARIQLEKK